jgi:superfamily II DNA or RNA helicase
MAVMKEEKKVALLLSPQRITTDFRVLNSLHITRSAAGVEYNMDELDNGEIRKYYSSLGKECGRNLLQFSPLSLDHTRQDLKQKINNQRAGINRDEVMRSAMVRHLFQLFQAMKPFAGLSKWYHRTSEDGKKYKTAPCVFNKFKPLLKFEVVKDKEQLKLQTIVELNNASYPLEVFKRYHFLLESGNEYFLLSYKDYQTLEWLDKVDWNSVANDATAFSQNVLIRLELDHSVNRNGHFTKKALVTVPINRVMLSELNNSFLMLTPQWLYDGFVVDGPFKDTYETVVDGEEYVIQRDKHLEDQFQQLLVTLHPNFAKQRNGYYYLSFADAQKKQWFLKTFHKLLDLNIELVGMDLLHHFRYSSFKPETNLVVAKEEGNRAILNVSVAFGKEEIPLNILQKMLLSGQKAVMLKDGTLGILGDDWLQKYAAIIKHGKVNKSQVDVARFMAITSEQLQGEEQVLQPLIKKQWWQKWRQWQQGEAPVYQLPPSVNATLRPYQQKGFEWLTLLAEAGAGGCLADDMGLGKTLQTICFLAYHIHLHPSSVNITPAISTLVYHGAGRSTGVLDQNHQVIITSYGTLRADSDALLSRQYGIAVIDESHNIKNPSAQITTAVNGLDAQTRIALSGTPVVNNTFDLYAQLNFSLPGMFGSREFFKREYADAIDRYRDEEKIQALQKLTAPFILRRTKEQVAKDLPEKSEMILWCSMSREQQELYNQIKDQIKSNLFLNIKSDGLNKSKLAVLQGMLKLRQVCNSPLLLPANEQQGVSESVKTELLLRELKNIIGSHKALVFSQFSTMLRLLASECEKEGIRFFHFDGQTPPAKRAEMVQAFQEEGNETNLFLISLKAGNTGLTLTAADYVFLFDPWWNTAVEQQAIDRTHRIGQTKNVFAYKIICKDTIEEKIIQLQQKKKKLAEDLVGEDDGFIKALTEEDIAYLFG